MIVNIATLMTVLSRRDMMLVENIQDLHRSPVRDEIIFRQCYISSLTGLPGKT